MTSSDAFGASSSLAGKTAIVTGGGSGIGRAIAERFAAAGARVAILDLSAADTVRCIGDAGGTAIHLDCDVTSQAAVSDAFGQVIANHGAPDILVNSAGVAHVGN